MDVNSNQTFTETATVGGFQAANDVADFDGIFESAIDRVEGLHHVNFRRDFTKAEVLDKDYVVADFKDSLLGKLSEDVNGKVAAFAEAAEETGNPLLTTGHFEGLYDSVSALFDRKVQDFVEAGQTVGSLEPIKTIDFPILVKDQIGQSYKDIVNEEITPSLQIKKQIEHHIVYSKKNPSKRWEYPQCLYDNDEFAKIMEEGKGTKLDTKIVTLPLYNYDIIDELTDVAVPGRARIATNDLSITTVVVEDGTEITLRTPMYVNLADGNWMGGKIHQEYTGTDTQKHVLDDALTGIMDWVTGTTTLTSSSGQVKSVRFSGRLSNEGNENTIRHEYTRETIDWYIEEGAKTDAAYTLEQLTENKAFLNMDLYKKSYNDICQMIIDIEDSSGFNFLDDEFKKYDGLDLDPLQWNPMIRHTTFNCDSTIATVALPSEYIASELKFKIDRFLLDIADDVKMDNMRFVCWGNPRYISLLQPNVKWIFNAGDRVGGVKLQYSYGVMTSGDTAVFVVASKKLNAKKYRGLRFLPFTTDKGTFTFKRYKYSTDVITAKDTAYHDDQLPGGSMTYVFGTSRFKDIALQGIQAELTFENAGFISYLNP